MFLPFPGTEWSNKEKESESGDKGLNAIASAYAPPKSKSKS